MVPDLVKWNKKSTVFTVYSLEEFYALVWISVDENVREVDREGKKLHMFVYLLGSCEASTALVVFHWGFQCSFSSPAHRVSSTKTLWGWYVVVWSQHMRNLRLETPLHWKTWSYVGRGVFTYWWDNDLRSRKSSLSVRFVSLKASQTQNTAKQFKIPWDRIITGKLSRQQSFIFRHIAHKTVERQCAKQTTRIKCRTYVIGQSNASQVEPDSIFFAGRACILLPESCQD